MKLGYTRKELLQQMLTSGDPQLVAQAKLLERVPGWTTETLFRVLAEKLGRPCKIDGNEVE